MKPSTSRALRHTLYRLQQGGISSSSSSSGSCSTWSFGQPTIKNRDLPPIRYHIFREPLPYPVGLKVQADIIDRRLAVRGGVGGEKEKGKGKGKEGGQDVLLLLEHVPTYTTGRRDNTPNPDTLHPEEKKVQNVGADFFITKRGGQVTYHGPGQLVGYPIFDLNAMELSTRCYVEYMQRSLGEYCTDGLGLKGIDAPHQDGHVGVFAGTAEKVASIGIHLRHRITSHGFAINVTPEPKAWFDLVVACGLADMRAVSIHDLLDRQRLSASAQGRSGDKGEMPRPTVRSAAEDIKNRFSLAYGREIIPLESEIQEDRGDNSGEIEEIRRSVEKAEEEAGKINKEKGGWRDAPDLKKDIP